MKTLPPEIMSEATCSGQSQIGFDPRNIFHLGYVVPNMERAIKAWARIGAIIVVPPSDDPVQKVSCALLFFHNSIPIELVAPLDPQDNPVKNRLARGGGLDHICFFSNDVEADLRSVVENGAQEIVGPVYGAVFDRELAFAVTRVGLVTEFMSRRPVGRLQHDPLAHALSGWNL